MLFDSGIGNFLLNELNSFSVDLAERIVDFSVEIDYCFSILSFCWTIVIYALVWFKACL